MTEARSFRGLDSDFKFARVVPGEVCELRHGDEEIERSDTNSAGEHDSPAMAEAPAEHGHILASEPREQRAAMSLFCSRLFVIGVSEESRGEHRREREGDEKRNHDGECDRDAVAGE